MASPEGKKGSSSGGRRRGSQTLQTPVIRREADAPVTLRGWLYKQGHDGLMLWKKRWFVLSQYCLFYYHGVEEEKVLGSILLPSYTISPCSEDRVYRKFAFKAQHRNTRTYYFAAETKESMIQWMNALSLATILHENIGSEINRNQSVNRASSSSTLNRISSHSKPSSSSSSLSPSQSNLNGHASESPGHKLDASFDSTRSRLDSSPDQPAGHRQPLYANAPPKPRRLNTSREYSSSPDRSPERDREVAELAAAAATAAGAASPATASGVMHDNYGLHQPLIQRAFHNGWGRPASAEVTYGASAGQQPSPQPMLVLQNSERRTPDAYGRFKADYEDVYNNSSSQSSSSSRNAQRPAGGAPFHNQRDSRDYAAALNANYGHHGDTKVAKKVPARPHSADFLEMSLSREDRRNRNGLPAGATTPQQQMGGDYWSEENYAQQVRQSSVLRNYPRSRDSSHSSSNGDWKSGPVAAAPAIVPRVVREDEISRDVKESALWSYVKQSTGPQPTLQNRLKFSNSQENLLDSGPDSETSTAKMFSRSASARLARHKQPDVHNTSFPDSKLKDMEMKKMEQREESMKRLLEWKQRMLQSPLTRKSGQRSERNTPTPQSLDSPRVHQQTPSAAFSRVGTTGSSVGHELLSQANPTPPLEETRSKEPTRDSGLINSNGEALRRPPSPSTAFVAALRPDYGSGGRSDSLRSATTAAAVPRSSDASNQAEQLFQASQRLMAAHQSPASDLMADSSQWSPNLAFRASLKRASVHKQLKLNEADVRKEFTYEYVSGDPGPVVKAADGVPTPRPRVWPVSQPSLMREKSSAIQDLRARSESPSANKVLGEQLLKEPLQPCTLSGLSAEAQVSHLKKEAAPVIKMKPKPPPKPSDLAPSLVTGQVKRLAMALEDFDSSQLPLDVTADEPSTQTSMPGSRFSLAESLPESLAGFAATIISEGTNSPIEPTVSPLTSECDWQNTNTSPAPLPDLMSLASAVSPLNGPPLGQCTSPPYDDARLQESLYMNTLHDSLVGVTAEDHYLPMTSAKLSILSRSPQPLPAVSFPASTNLAKSEFEENAYVEMQDDGRKLQVGSSHGRTGGDGKASGSVFAGILDPSYRQERDGPPGSGPGPAPESPRYSEISDCAIHSAAECDQPHYEFIYKASTQGEPVYMEVPQGDDCSGSVHNGHDMTSHSIAEPQEPRHIPSADHSAVSVASVSRSAAENRSLGEGDEEASRSSDFELDLIAPPRHPRFSLSDTFRPASYFLNSGAKIKRLETISSREDLDFEGHESSDSDLVSPPPIPNSPLLMEEFGSRNRANSQPSDALSRLRSFTNPNPHQQQTTVSHSRSHSLDMKSDVGGCRAPLENRLSHPIGSAHSSSSRSSLTSESTSRLNNSWQEASCKRRPLAIVRSLEDLLVDSTSPLPDADVRRGSVEPVTESPFRASTQSLSASTKLSGVSEWNQPLYENVQPFGGSSPSPLVEQPPRRVSASMLPPESPASIGKHPTGPIHQRGNSTLSSLSIASSASTSSVSRSEQNGAPYYYSDLLAGKIDETIKSDGGEQDAGHSGRDSGLRNRIALSKHSYSIDRLRTVHHNPRDLGHDKSTSSMSRRSADRKYSATSLSPDGRPNVSMVSRGTAGGGVGGEENDSPQNHLERSRRAQTPDLLANSSAYYQSADGYNCHSGRLSNGSSPAGIRSGQVMRRVRSLEGLLDDEDAPAAGSDRQIQPLSSTPNPGQARLNPPDPGSLSSCNRIRNGSTLNDRRRETESPGPNPHHSGSAERTVLKETPRYARDPTSKSRLSSGTLGPSGTNLRSPAESTVSPTIGEFSAWDEDGLWRDKLRRASIRHTRSLDMLDEAHTRKPRSAVAPLREPEEANHSVNTGPDEGDCYERLLQYSATLERTKRGQTYLDGYTWDEMEQRFRKPDEEPPSRDPRPVEARATTTLEPNPTQHHFLDESLPPAFEIDREKLRQWDLMSTAPILTGAEGAKEGGRRSARHRANHQRPKSSKDPNKSQTAQCRQHVDVVAPENDCAPSRGGNCSDVSHLEPVPATVLHPSRCLAPELSLHSPPPPPPPPPDLTLFTLRNHAPNVVPVPPSQLPAGGTSPTTEFAAAAGSNATPTNGTAQLKSSNVQAAPYQNGFAEGSAQSSALITSQPQSSTGAFREDLYLSDTDMPRKKGKLPAMIGQSRESSNVKSEKLQLSAGDLLGRTHEELVLLLIQLRRQSSALVKARDACILEMESQVKLAALDISHRQECLSKTGDLKRHVKELEKQLEKLKPLINLVDNMVKLGSLYPLQKRMRQAKVQPGNVRNSPGSGTEFHGPATSRRLPSQSQAPPQRSSDSPTYTNVHHWRATSNPSSHVSPNLRYGSAVQGWEEAQIAQLESKHKQLSRLESFVREEGVSIQRLTQNQNVLRLAIRGIREQINTALQNGDYPEVEHCRRQQLFLERELSQVHSLLALSSKRLEDTAVEINRIEQDISSLHQQLHRASVVGTIGRSGKSPQSTLSRSPAGKEMVWLEAELERVHQHVSQLQLRRQELSSQVGRLTSPECSPPSNLNDHWHRSDSSKRKTAGTWFETDLDSMNTIDRVPHGDYSSANSTPLYVNAAAFCHDPMPLNDINEADDRMKRYYGIIPKDKPSEIRGTVRIVKRESEKRQRDKTKRSPFDDSSNYGAADDLVDDDPSAHHQTNGFHDDVQDTIMNDPVLSQFSHVLTLPRRGRDAREAREIKDAKKFSTVEYRSRRSSLSHEMLSDSYQDSPSKESINRRRNVSSLSLAERNPTASSSTSDLGPTSESVGDDSLDSTQPSPVLTPVYTSDAAREIVEEMRRRDAMAVRRAVPRHKRRHITVSCSQPLVLEALPRPGMRGFKGRAKDDADMERALRFHHPFAPDVVRSTIGQPLRINDKTIDRIFCAPDKILIPERYIPEQQVEEVGEEEKQRRLKKAESIRRMLTGSAAVELPRPPSVAVANENIELSEAKQLLAKERRQRDHFLGLNHFLVEELREKSKMVAVRALAKMKSRREHSSDEDDWSPPPDPLPIYQQRYNYLT